MSEKTTRSNPRNRDGSGWYAANKGIPRLESCHQKSLPPACMTSAMWTETARWAELSAPKLAPEAHAHSKPKQIIQKEEKSKIRRGWTGVNLVPEYQGTWYNASPIHQRFLLKRHAQRPLKKCERSDPCCNAEIVPGDQLERFLPGMKYHLR